MKISLTFAKKIASLHFDIAESYCMANFKKLTDSQIFDKNGGTNIVTQIDIDAEYALSQALLPLIDDALFVGEEIIETQPDLLTRAKQAEYVWLVDPLDGTRNFANNVLMFSSMISLIHNGETIFASLYDSDKRDMAVAVKKQGAFYLNSNDTITVQPSDNIDISKMVGNYSKFVRHDLMTKNITNQLTGDEATYSDKNIDTRLEAMNQVVSLKCAGMDFIMLAQGKRDFSLYHNLHPWDHAAGKLLLEEAGGAYCHIPAYNTKTNYHPLEHSQCFLAVKQANMLERVKKILCLA
ncbi:MAG: inositol monophosphatase [Alphaproteobacteria bacterium]|nr:inositol monophosphatase [Alphaproteobacteria bacterium]